jgi:hypothetical protein
MPHPVPASRRTVPGPAQARFVGLERRLAVFFRAVFLPAAFAPASLGSARARDAFFLGFAFGDVSAWAWSQ